MDYSARRMIIGPPADRTWSQQHRVDDAEYGGVRADTEPERDDGDEGEVRRLQQRAQCKFKVTVHS
jgi:hypothetical protein